MAARSYGPDMVWVCVNCDLDLGDRTFGQGHDTSQGHDTTLGHGPQLCELDIS